MNQNNPPSGYKQGYSESTLSTHLKRTADSDAGFLLPSIKKTDYVLDVGCGPGSITIGLAKHASEGKTIGLDISPDVLKKAQALALEASMPSEGPGSIQFLQGDILKQLPFSDGTFDVIFASQVFGHIPGPDLPVQALVELRRVMKPGGIIATRDGFSQHFYPSYLNLDKLWVSNMHRMIMGDSAADSTGTMMPALLRKAGLRDIVPNARAVVLFDQAARKKLAERAAGQLKEGDPFRQSWLDAGITPEECQKTVKAAAAWAELEDAMFVSVHGEMLARK